MNNMTQATKQEEIKRNWHIVDVKGKTLGRESTRIAKLLMGKNKPYFVRNLDCGDFVIILNAKYITVSGKKEDAKKYRNYSGYPGGLRTRTLREVRTKKPEEIVEHAVKGMLPQNKLRDQLLKRLKVFPGDEHPYQDKFKN